MIGDLIMYSWENGGKVVWDEYYKDCNVFNLGFSGDCIE